MNEMSGREQKLILFLGVFAILALFLRFILLPSLDELSSLDAQIAEEQTKQTEIQMKAGRLDSLKQNHDALMQQYLDATVDFFPMLSTQEIGHKLTSMVESLGNRVTSMTITPPQSPITIQPYIGSELYQQQQEQQAKQNQANTDAATSATSTSADSSANPTTDSSAASSTNQIAAINDTATAIGSGSTTDSSSGTGNGTPDLSQISAVDLMFESAVALTISGSTAGIEALLDQLEAETSIKVLSWRSEVRTQDGGNVQVTQINLMVYMCEKQTQ